MVSSFIPCCFARVQDLAKQRSYTDRCAGGTGKITKRATTTEANTVLGLHPGLRLRRPILCWVGTHGLDYGGQYCVGSAPTAATTEANTVLGRHPGASERLKTEVLRKMTNDSIGQIVRHDQLIIQLGNDSLLKKVKNCLQRGIYTSVLQQMRQESNDTTLT